jgi:CRP-like cAMP-binding protein
MDLVAHFRGAKTLTTVESGLPIFSEGEAGGNMYVLMEGSVAICIGGKVVEVAGPGSLIGEMALIDSSVRSATAITRTQCRVISINGRQFDLLVRESPEFARHVMEVMADRLRRMNELYRVAAAAAAPARGDAPMLTMPTGRRKDDIIVPV